MVLLAPPEVLLPAPEVPLDEPAPPSIGLPEVELDDPPRAPPVGLAEPPVEVGARVVVTVEPSPLVVVRTDPPAITVDVVLSPVATTTVLVPVLEVTVEVAPSSSLLLAYSKSHFSSGISLHSVIVPLTLAERVAKVNDSIPIGSGRARLVGAVANAEAEVLIIAQAGDIGRVLASERLGLAQHVGNASLLKELSVVVHTR